MKRNSWQHFVQNRSRVNSSEGFKLIGDDKVRGTITAKINGTVRHDYKEDALSAVKSKLLTGEEIRWTGSASSTFFLIDLTYKGLMWWSVFALIVPIYGSSIELTALLVLMLTWLEFKKQWNGRVYFITETRAIYADKTRKGQWLFTDYPLVDLVSTKQTAILKSLVMQFRTTRGIKTLKFPYLADATEAISYLKVKTDNLSLTDQHKAAPLTLEPQSIKSPDLNSD